MNSPTGEPAAVVRVLHLTDPHLFAAADGELRGVVTWDSLNRVLDHHRASGWPADLVIVSGDVVQDDSAAAYDRFRHGLVTLALPVLCVPGNHDVRTLMQRACSDPPFEYCSLREAGRWLIAGLDSCLPGQVGGAVAPAELERLRRSIDQGRADHVLVYLHHPPVDLQSAWLDKVGLQNGAECLRVFARTGRVRIVLFGHAHQAYDDARDGMQLLGTPSTCRQFRPLSDTFAVDDRAPAYRRLELAADGRFSTRLVWLDDD